MSVRSAVVLSALRRYWLLSRQYIRTADLPGAFWERLCEGSGRRSHGRASITHVEYAGLVDMLHYTLVTSILLWLCTTIS